MGTIVRLEDRRPKAAQRTATGNGKPRRGIVCAQCGESHPIIRLSTGENNCVTAFHDGERWFCKHRGCRRAWLDANPE